MLLSKALEVVAVKHTKKKNRNRGLWLSHHTPVSVWLREVSAKLSDIVNKPENDGWISGFCCTVLCVKFTLCGKTKKRNKKQKMHLCISGRRNNVGCFFAFGGGRGAPEQTVCLWKPWKRITLHSLLRRECLRLFCAVRLESMFTARPVCSSLLEFKLHF